MYKYTHIYIHICIHIYDSGIKNIWPKNVQEIFILLLSCYNKCNKKETKSNLEWHCTI